jgi:hypothetical protein
MQTNLKESDEYTHMPESDTSYNESMYFNFFDQENDMGGFVRLGNRINEKYAEETLCIWLKDNTVVFNYQKPEITTNDCFKTPNTAFSVITPFKSLKVIHSSNAILLNDPEALNDPKSAFMNSLRSDCKLDLLFTGLCDPVGGESQNQNNFAKGHYEQLVKAAGKIQVDSKTFDVEAFGLRDHSWGPRSWQAPNYYRWINACFGPDFGFMGTVINFGSIEAASGFLYSDGELKGCESDIKLNDKGLTMELSYADKRLLVTGIFKSEIPLRNTPKKGPNDSGINTITKIRECFTYFHTDTGRAGYGITEIVDQVNVESI